MTHCPHCRNPLEATFAYCPSCAQPVAPGREAPERAASSRLPWVERTIVLAAVLVAVALVAAPLGLTPRIDLAALRGSAGGGDGYHLEPVRAEPDRFVMNLVDEEMLEMDAGDYLDTPFELDDPRACLLSGEVEGMAGGGRDLEVYVLDESGFQNWREGVRPDALFASGRATSALMEVELPSPGRYHLLLSNRYSLFTGKRVRVEDARVTCG